MGFYIEVRQGGQFDSSCAFSRAIRFRVFLYFPTCYLGITHLYLAFFSRVSTCNFNITHSDLAFFFIFPSEIWTLRTGISRSSPHLLVKFGHYPLGVRVPQHVPSRNSNVKRYMVHFSPQSGGGPPHAVPECASPTIFNFNKTETIFQLLPY